MCNVSEKDSWVSQPGKVLQDGVVGVDTHCTLSVLYFIRKKKEVCLFASIFLLQGMNSQAIYNRYESALSHCCPWKEWMSVKKPCSRGLNGCEWMYLLSGLMLKIDFILSAGGTKIGNWNSTMFATGKQYDAWNLSSTLMIWINSWIGSHAATISDIASIVQEQPDISAWCTSHQHKQSFQTDTEEEVKLMFAVGVNGIKSSDLTLPGPRVKGWTWVIVT